MEQLKTYRGSNRTFIDVKGNFIAGMGIQDKSVQVNILKTTFLQLELQT